MLRLRRSDSSQEARRVSASASIRASGHDDLPDTYYIHSFSRQVQRVGVGCRLLISVRSVHSDLSTESLYSVTLGPIRVRGKTIVEFLGYSSSFLHGLCYVQVPLARADIGKFPFLDLLRGRGSVIDPIPAYHVRCSTPVPLPAGNTPRGNESVEIRVDVECTPYPTMR